MSISAPFIRRPDRHFAAALRRCCSREFWRFSFCRWRRCRRWISRDQRWRGPARCESGDDGIGGGHSAGAPVRTHRRREPDDIVEPAGLAPASRCNSILNRNIDAAARDVQAAINAARSQLAANLPSNPSYRKVNPADAPILILALTSDTMTVPQMYDAADSILSQKLAQVRGVGQVFVGGAARPAVRAEVNPNLLNKLGIGLDTVRNALNAANANRPKGEVSNDSRRTGHHRQRPDH